MMTVTTEQVLAKIKVDDSYAVNCLVKLYERQTADERAAQTTAHDNGVGFNGADAYILSSFAEQVVTWKATPVGERRYSSPLSVKQMDLLRKKLVKYGRQITELTNVALAEKVGALETMEQQADRLARESETARAADQRREWAERVLGPLGPTQYHPLPAHLREKYEAERIERELPMDELPTYDQAMIDADDAAGDAVREEREAEELSYMREHLPTRNGFDVPPSCRLVVNGNDLRFPTAKELERTDRGARELQRSLSSARWTRPCEPDEDIFSE